MKLIKRIKTYLEIRSRKAKEREILGRVKEEINLLNVFRIDGIDVITYDGLITQYGQGYPGQTGRVQTTDNM